MANKEIMDSSWQQMSIASSRVASILFYAPGDPDSNFGDADGRIFSFCTSDVRGSLILSHEINIATT